MARTGERVEGRLRRLEAIFRSGGFEFTDQDRGHLKDYLRNNDGRSRYEHLIDLDASGLAHSAAAFERESRRSLDDSRAPATLADAHRRLFQHADPGAGQRRGQVLSQQASAAGENLRNLSEPKPFAKAAGEYYTAVDDSAPHGPGSGIAAQLFIDRQACAAGHSVDWQQFHQIRNASAGQVLMTGSAGDQSGRNEQAFSAAIFLRQFRRPEQRPSPQRQASRTAGTGRQGALGRLRSGLGLGRRQERPGRQERTGRDARGGQPGR